MSAGKNGPVGQSIIPYKEGKENSITAETKSLPNKEAKSFEEEKLRFGSGIYRRTYTSLGFIDEDVVTGTRFHYPGFIV